MPFTEKLTGTAFVVPAFAVNPMPETVPPRGDGSVPTHVRRRHSLAALRIGRIPKTVTDCPLANVQTSVQPFIADDPVF